MKIALIILWTINGILNLWFGEISRFSYGAAWFSLMLYLIMDALR